MENLARKEKSNPNVSPAAAHTLSDGESHTRRYSTPLIAATAPLPAVAPLPHPLFAASHDLHQESWNNCLKE
ncbi:hypothetical protein Dsin_009940 [Dipteronia sinensis]|uniref:Uncharacterized protein n=1 Tax=Dipteronia sinensis TaxID=43782 RepID=A0AAE0ASG8_9ROSI|nr:hypothetical protein Dsin_009940 [Dipteronia sinensis]